MSIEQMHFVNIVGTLSKFKQTMLKISKSEILHLEEFLDKATPNVPIFSKQYELYKNTLNSLYKLFDILVIPKTLNQISLVDLENFDLNCELIKNIHKILEFVEKKNSEIIKIRNRISLLRQCVVQIKHMQNLKANVDELFTSEFMDVHFGRIPFDSYIKLEYIKNLNFIFFKLDETKEFCWGIYLTDSKSSKQIQEVFKSLYFEEYIIPSYVKGTPIDAIKDLEAKIDIESENLAKLNSQLYDYKNFNFEKLVTIYSKIKILHEILEYRKFVKIKKDMFYLNGFVAESKIDELMSMFNDTSEVMVEVLPDSELSGHEPPVKLKTCRLFKPFEMYVETYGLPRYDSFNPSSFVGLVYSLLFGIMFADIGQGMCLTVGGLVFWKLKNNRMGLILNRCGFCSMVFGLVVDSFFGFEGLFSWFWNIFGLSPTLPINLLQGKNTIALLMLSLFIGMSLISISMIINIFITIKNKNFLKSIFSSNGVVGLIFYGGLCSALIGKMLFNVNLFSWFFVVLVVLVPIILIYMSEFILQKFSKNKPLLKVERFSFINSSFDMIDILLSYFTNTLSFLRIGGLALSHAALMLVVMKLAEIFGIIVAPVVVIGGNLLIMALECLIVSIQDVRLVYYEIFSRFYSAEGKPFNPVKVKK